MLERLSTALATLPHAVETIVVDNDSSDRTAAIAVTFGARVVTEPVHNIARVRNAGAHTADGDVLVFIDADTLVPAGLFDRIGSALRDERCLGGAVAVGYEPFQRKWMKYYMLGWRFWGRVFNMKQGAAQFCRRRAFADLAGYNDQIYMGEDIEFYWRLSGLAKREGGFLHFIEDIKVVTSSRRFDKMGLGKTLFLTHPLIIWLNWKRRSLWKDWYEKPLR